MANVVRLAAVYPPNAYKLPCVMLRTPKTPKIKVKPRETKNNNPAYEIPSAKPNSKVSKFMV
jgi:hypothetical protein